jgi:hypothetical protein
MRKVVALLALVMLAALLPAQTGEWADKLFAKAGTSHNFGNVPRGAVLHHRFPMTNIYAVPLQITGTRVSCGCVTVTPSANVLQPKETGYVDITMDARRFTGAKTVNIYITVGPQFVSTATLQVSANSRADVVFNPGQVNFGVVPAGRTPSETIDVEYAGVLDWRIQGIAQHSYPLEIKYRELYREVGRVGYRLQVQLKAGAPPGPFKHELLLQTNDPASLLVPVLVEGNIQAALTAAPALVKFDGVKVGDLAAKKVIVNGNGQKLFRILEVEGLPEGLTADFSPTPAPVQVLTLSWRPGKAFPLKGDLLIKTDLDGGATVRVAAEGTLTP